MRPEKIWGEGHIKKTRLGLKRRKEFGQLVTRPRWDRVQRPARVGPRAQPACLGVFGAEANRDCIRGSGEQAPHEESFPEQAG